MLLRRSGAASRVADLRIDAAAKASAQAVRSAGNDGATERFLSRFLDHLHDTDNSSRRLARSTTIRRRGPRGAGAEADGLIRNRCLCV